MTLPLIERLREHLAPALRLERELGGGGMSHVYVATDPSLERPVVVKVLPPERTAQLSAERFRREIAIAARLQHPNIVPVLAAGVADGLLWFSMPFVAGRSLRARIADEGAIDAAAAIPILRDVARALAFAHRQGIVHRDVKPDNILLTEDGAATVTDFGIAKAIDTARTQEVGDNALTQAGNALGTPQYMAPEQIAGDPDMDGRADLYAFGVVAYEMLTGRPPFHGRPASQVLSAHLAEAPVPVATARPSVPPSLGALVDRCLAKDPAARPASADAVVQALDAAATTGSVATRPRMASRTLRASLAVATLVVAAGVAGWAYLGRDEAPTLDASLVAVAPFRIVDPSGDLRWLGEGMLDLLAAKLSGEGGVRATEPRSVLARWQALRETAGGADAEPPREDALRMARDIGASTLLLGEVLPAANGIELHATIIDAGTGAERHRVTVGGARDSVVGLAERLAVQVLTRLAGVTETRVLPLANVSLEALRPYLEGQSLLRRLRAEDATAAYLRALDADSTFALAAIGAVQSTSWYGAQDTRVAALATAWRYRGQLSARDLSLLEALAGPRYPAGSSTAELLRAREQFLARMPDSPDSWYMFGDMHFHFGGALGIRGSRAIAATHFRRALELDSGYVPGYAHLSEIAVTDGDEALLERTLRLRASHDTTRFTKRTTAWHHAVRTGDSVTASAIIDSVLAERLGGYAFTFADYAMSDGYGLASALALMERLADDDGQRAVAQNRQRIAANLLYVAGAPDAAAVRLRQGGPAGDPTILTRLVRVGLAGDGEGRIADSAAAELAAMDDVPASGPDSVVLLRREVTRTLALWRLVRGDSSSASRDIERVRAMNAQLRASSQANDAPRDVHVEVLEMLRARLRLGRGRTTDSIAFRDALTALEARAAELDWGAVNVERTVALSLLSSRFFEEAGDLPGAIRMAGRGTYRNGGELHPYFAVQARTLARLATKSGDIALARESWERLLQLRVRVEPRFSAELTEARRALTP